MPFLALYRAAHNKVINAQRLGQPAELKSFGNTLLI
jgi:hypothetical protein